MIKYSQAAIQYMPEEEFKEVPLIIGIKHKIPWHSAFYEDVSPDAKKVEPLLESLAKEKRQRTLFIESGSEKMEFIKKEVTSRAKQGKEALYQEPFAFVMNFAWKHGWKVVLLDKISIAKLDGRISYENGRTLPHGYTNKNVRERSWANKIKFSKPSSNDLIIMDPAHVKGFVQECKQKHLVVKRVKYISPPIKPIGTLGKRYNASHIDWLNEKRLRQRKLKSPNAFEAPKQLTFDFLKSAKYWSRVKKHP